MYTRKILKQVQDDNAYKNWRFNIMQWPRVDIKNGALMKQTTVLCVLDGVGENPDSVGNAVTQAYTPNLDRFYDVYPHSQLATHGNAVGLPDGQMGTPI